jgi:transposase
MKTLNQSQTKRTGTGKAGRTRGPVQRDAKEVMAEMVARLSQKLDTKATARGGGSNPDLALKPNRDGLTVGVDLGDRWSHYCILGLDGETLVEGELQTSQQHFSEFFGALAPARVVMEVGTHSAWARDVVAGCGHEVLVANPRQMEGPKKRKRKNDRIDAHKLARVGRMDPQSLFPIQHRSVEVRRDLLTLWARGALVQVWTELINATRGLVKSMGARLPKCSTQAFAKKAERELPAEVREILLPLVEIVKGVSDAIQSYDERIEELAAGKYPQTNLLRQVKGVGPQTSLAYVLTLEDPKRFSRSRDVGPYIGLVPKQEDSGDRQPQLRISVTDQPGARRRYGERSEDGRHVGLDFYDLLIEPILLDRSIRRGPDRSSIHLQRTIWQVPHGPMASVSLYRIPVLPGGNSSVPAVALWRCRLGEARRRLV